MLHLGMTREADFRKKLNWNDKWTDQCFYLILEDEYKNRIQNIIQARKFKSNKAALVCEMEEDDFSDN